MRQTVVVVVLDNQLANADARLGILRTALGLRSPVHVDINGHGTDAVLGLNLERATREAVLVLWREVHLAGVAAIPTLRHIEGVDTLVGLDGHTAIHLDSNQVHAVLVAVVTPLAHLVAGTRQVAACEVAARLVGHVEIVVLLAVDLHRIAVGRYADDLTPPEYVAQLHVLAIHVACALRTVQVEGLTACEVVTALDAPEVVDLAATLLGQEVTADSGNLRGIADIDAHRLAARVDAIEDALAEYHRQATQQPGHLDLGIADAVAIGIEIVGTADDVGSTREYLVATRHHLLLHLQRLKDGLHADVEFIDGEFGVTIIIIGESPASVGNAVAREVTALHLVGLHALGIDALGKERLELAHAVGGDLVESLDANPQALQEAYLLLGSVLGLLIEVVGMQVARGGHQRVGVDIVGRGVGSGHALQFLTAQYEVIERRARLHDDALQEGDYLRELVVGVPVNVLHGNDILVGSQ